MNEIPQLPTVPHPNGDGQVYSYPVGAYKLFRIDPNDAYSSKFLLSLVIRALQFLPKYGSESDPQWIVDLVYSNFKQKTNLVHLLVAINEKEEIVGHTISYIDTLGTLGYVVHVLQVEKDVPDQELSDKAVALIEDWACSLKIKTIMSCALSRKEARMNQHYGFQEFRFLMRKNLHE